MADASPSLNAAQFAAATAPAGPLLIIAGAGTGKTQTLAHRVAHLIKEGADPARILLLTLTRRAADVMVRRARRIVSASGNGKRATGNDTTLPVSRFSFPWAGTFHAVANRLLRLHASVIELAPSFTVLDRSDSADLLNVVRNDLGF